MAIRRLTIGDESGRIYIGKAVGCMTTWTFYETAAPGEMHSRARDSLSVFRYKSDLYIGSRRGGEGEELAIMERSMKDFTLFI